MRFQTWVSVVVLLVVGSPGSAQPEPVAPPKGEVPAPPPATAVAATVNGQPISELAVYRVLIRELPQNRDRARKEVLEYLIGNILVDQFLLQQKVGVAKLEVDKRLEQMRDEAKKESQDFDKILKTLFLTEEELRFQLTCALRWEKYAEKQATEKTLQELFAKNRALFDGSQMQARHILISGDAEKARAKLLAIKKRIEDRVGQEVANLSDRLERLEQEKARMKALEKAFAEAAKESDCPSKAEGGNLGWFPRAGAMVEPFARAAFALKPYQLSEPIATEFGQHLILAIEHKPGKDIKLDDILPVVKEVYFDRLRDALVHHLKPQAQIVIQGKQKK